jgi:hypothetical protein
MDLMGFPQSAPNATAVLGRRIVNLEARISSLISQLEHQQQHQMQQQVHTIPTRVQPSPMRPDASIPPPHSPTTTTISSPDELNMDPVAADFPVRINTLTVHNFIIFIFYLTIFHSLQSQEG